LEQFSWTNTLLATVLAYALGSLSFAVIVSRVMRLPDPRTFGSGNPGATNVLRSGSKVAAVVTLLLDAMKGWLALALASHFAVRFGLDDSSLALVGLAAFLGHLFPVFFRFKGGKGVATALGVLMGFDYRLGLAAAICWLLVAYFSRYSSLAALVAAVAAPVIYLLGGDTLWVLDSSIALSITAMAAFLLWRHKQNISRLIKGTESRIGAKKAKSAR
jgi:glycerol-3-phosphate acyltransferase PlsY